MEMSSEPCQIDFGSDAAIGRPPRTHRDILEHVQGRPDPGPGEFGEHMLLITVLLLLPLERRTARDGTNGCRTGIGGKPGRAAAGDRQAGKRQRDGVRSRSHEHRIASADAGQNGIPCEMRTRIR